jgi:hypothetical protein
MLEAIAPPEMILEALMSWLKPPASHQSLPLEEEKTSREAKDKEEEEEADGKTMHTLTELTASLQVTSASSSSSSTGIWLPNTGKMPSLEYGSSTEGEDIVSPSPANSGLAKDGDKKGKARAAELAQEDQPSSPAAKAAEIVMQLGPLKESAKFQGPSSKGSDDAEELEAAIDVDQPLVEDNEVEDGDDAEGFLLPSVDADVADSVVMAGSSAFMRVFNAILDWKSGNAADCQNIHAFVASQEDFHSHVQRAFQRVLADQFEEEQNATWQRELSTFVTSLNFSMVNPLVPPLKSSEWTLVAILLLQSMEKRGFDDLPRAIQKLVLHIMTLDQYEACLLLVSSPNDSEGS